MKIAIVDDELKEREKMMLLLDDLLGESAVIDVFADGEAFLNRTKEIGYDLVVLDIFIDESFGIDVAKKLREKNENVRIVFCSTSNEFASESYEVGASYYLRKPFDEQSVKTMLEKIRLADYEEEKSITLPDGQKLIAKNMLYSLYHNHVITVYVKRGEPIQTRLTQTEFEALLSEFPCFCSPSKGIVVNFREVTRKEETFVVLSNGESVPVSRRRNKEFSALYEEFRFDEIRKELDK